MAPKWCPLGTVWSSVKWYLLGNYFGATFQRGTVFPYKFQTKTVPEGYLNSALSRKKAPFSKKRVEMVPFCKVALLWFPLGTVSNLSQEEMPNIQRYPMVSVTMYISTYTAFDLRGSLRKNQAGCESSPPDFFQISMKYDGSPS